MNKRDKILWVDDEIDLLSAYTIFLEEKGYQVFTATNGQDAIEMCREQSFDVLFLDENMPGLNGLETLAHVKQILPSVPVVMITKSEEENIMDMAIGNKIADYLIKPVNPNQILMTLKKHLHKKEILVEQTTTGYRSDFALIGSQLSEHLSDAEWKAIYKKLVYWDLELDEADNDMHEMLHFQKVEANTVFAKYIKRNYENWCGDPDNRPMLSPDIFKKKIFPMLESGEKVFFILVDNFRLDQWEMVRSTLNEFFTMEEDGLYFSILPTATQYARNAIFSGLWPNQIQEMYPDLWVEEDEEEGKNLHEEELIQTQLDRFRKKYEFTYHKISHAQMGEKLIEQLHTFENTPLHVCVLNFVDMLSHARTESKMIRELANSESAYRSLTSSWFRHSFAYPLFKELARRNFKVVITTDHGAICVDKPIKVVGDKNTNVNLRYKLGKSLAYNKKEVFEMLNPLRFGLPSPNVSSVYIFAMNNDFFAYPNNFNYYVSYYKETFQHGGISMEEMLCPFVVMQPKR